MVKYRRIFVRGRTFFFTHVLADPRSSALTDNIAVLREAFRAVRRERPFHIDAAVVLPDHLHAVITLPNDDLNYPQLWRSIKARFTRDLRKSGMRLRVRDRTGYVLWQRRFWEHAIRD